MDTSFKPPVYRQDFFQDDTVGAFDQFFATNPQGKRGPIVAVRQDYHVTDSRDHVVRQSLVLFVGTKKEDDDLIEQKLEPASIPAAKDLLFALQGEGVDVQVLGYGFDGLDEPTTRSIDNYLTNRMMSIYRFAGFSVVAYEYLPTYDRAKYCVGPDASEVERRHFFGVALDPVSSAHAAFCQAERAGAQADLVNRLLVSMLEDADVDFKKITPIPLTKEDFLIPFERTS